MNYKTLRLIAVALFVISFSGTLNGDIMLTVDNPTVRVGPNESIILTAAGIDPISNLDLVAVINAFDGSGPEIQSFTGLGVFAGVTPAFPPGGNPPARATNLTFTGPFTPVSIDGQDFVAIGFDTSALSVGDTFDLSLSFNSIDTVFTNNQDPNPFVNALFPEAFQITVVSNVPEPSSLALLLATGSLALLRRRKLA